jgi:hypothetical protein
MVTWRRKLATAQTKMILRSCRSRHTIRQPEGSSRSGPSDSPHAVFFVRPGSDPLPRERRKKIVRTDMNASKK